MGQKERKQNMPHTGKPYRVGDNWFVNENIRHPSGCQTSKMVPLSIDQVRQMSGLPARPKPPGYVEKPLSQQIREGLAAGKTPADILPFGGQKPGEISESYEQRLKRAESLEREIARAQKRLGALHG